MKLHIKQLSLRAAALFYYCGLAIMLLSLLGICLIASYTDYLMTMDWLSKICLAILILGLIMAAVGVIWKRKLYRCPKCDCNLLIGGGFFREPPQYCGRCGIKIDICIDSKKSR